MKKIILYILISFPIIVIADTLEQSACNNHQLYCNNEIYCCNTGKDEKQVELKIKVDNLKVRLEKYVKEFESHEDEIRSSVKQIEISQAIIDSRTSELKESMWNTINWMATLFYGSIGVGFAGGGIFIWRESNVNKNRMETEMITIKLLKKEAEKQLADTVTIIEDNKIKIQEELSCLRRRSEIDRLMDAKSSDYNTFFPLISFISKFPTLENLISLKKLESYTSIPKSGREHVKKLTLELKEKLDKSPESV